MSGSGGFASRGFTMIEMVTVLALLGTLGVIAAPSIRSAVYRADAARVVADIDMVQQAAYEYMEGRTTVPRSRGWGRVPPELESHLPQGFEFTYKDLRYRWRRHGRGAVGRMQVAYPADSMIGDALKRFRSDRVNWTRRRATFTVYETSEGGR